MAWTKNQKLAHYRQHPELRRKYQRRWREKIRRQAEIEGAKQSLLSAHRLRAIGVPFDAIRKYEGDSWSHAATTFDISLPA